MHNKKENLIKNNYDFAIKIIFDSKFVPQKLLYEQ